MLEISIQSLEKSYNVTPILDDITFDVQSGDRIGIIGRNGTGKTTLFKILMGKEPYNGGLLTFRKNMKLGYLDQVPDYPESTLVWEVIREALYEVDDIQNQMRAMELEMSELKGEALDPLMRRYGNLSERFEAQGGYERYVDEQKLIEGFRFERDFLNRSFSQLSGGEKTRVMLARLILSNPDVLLLDEPSNHLDTDALEWLETYMLKYKGAVVAISHDRFFLDTVVNKIVEIEDRLSHVYHGNYAYYKEEKEKRMILWIKDYNNQQKQLKSMQDAIDRFRAWSSCGQDKAMIAKIKNMEKRMDRIEKIDKPIVNRKQIRVDFSSKERSGNEVLRMTALSHGFGSRVLFRHLNALIGYKDSFALLGPNGCGKSTLLKIITGALEAQEGHVKIGSRVKWAYLDQNVVLGDEHLNVLELYRSYYPCKEGEARSVLARSLFIGDDLFKEVHLLSGGEKMRLKLCILMQQEVNFLILDEPTNHLDIESREMLEATLTQFEGTILFVSHDRYFVKKLATRIGELDKGSLKIYEGNYGFYQEKKMPKPVAQKAPVKTQRMPAMKPVKTVNVEVKYEEIEAQMALIEDQMLECATDYVQLESLLLQRDQLELALECLLEEA